MSDLTLDRTSSPKIHVNFNLSLLDLRCDYATINVVSVLGNEQNITKDITRHALDEEGTRNDALRNVHHHHEDNRDILMADPTVTESLEELHENGQDVVSLDETTLQYALDEKGTTMSSLTNQSKQFVPKNLSYQLVSQLAEYVFVKYYADW